MKTTEANASPNFFARNHASEAQRVSTKKFRVSVSEAVFMIIAFFFSFWLMFHTFSYDTARQEMKIASKAWSDFGAHIPLIRSFSYGPNLDRLQHLQPIESPLFPGEPLRYHFGFYALVGLLERLGMRIDWALNIPSALGFLLLLILIYHMSLFLFQNRWVSWVSVMFFLFNGSLSFVNFFKTLGVTDIITNSRFPSFGPWDGNPITAFWTLNIYTNQRHLALSYALVLFVILNLIQDPSSRRSKILRAACVSFLLFLNYPAAAIAVLFLIFQLDVVPLLLSIPAFFLLQQYTHLSSAIAWQPGYLAQGNIISFWWQNLGAHLTLIPLGIALSPKRVRPVLLAPMLLLFLLPNLFRFSPDMINNHKFFNFFLIIGNMFSAFTIVSLFCFASRFHSLIRVFWYSLICLFVLLLTLSGIIDFFPIVNDSKGSIPDRSEDVKFFLTHAKPTDVIANSTWFYHPGSIAGRAVYSGYTYFTWSYGYDQGGRERTLETIYRVPDRSTLCQTLRESHIAYTELNNHPEAYIQPNWDLWNSLLPVYNNPETGVRIFSTHDICEN